MGGLSARSPEDVVASLCGRSPSVQESPRIGAVRDVSGMAVNPFTGPIWGTDARARGGWRSRRGGLTRAAKMADAFIESPLP